MKESCFVVCILAIRAIRILPELALKRESTVGCIDLENTISIVILRNNLDYRRRGPTKEKAAAEQGSDTNKLSK
jgi:hypothetical protein